MCFSYDERFLATVTSIVKVAEVLRSMLAKCLNYSKSDCVVTFLESIVVL